MLRRVELLMPGAVGVSSRVWGGTFHHIGNRILRRHAPLVGFQPNYTILDQEDAKSLMETCITELKMNPKGSRFPKGEVLEDIVGLAVNTQRPIEEIVLERYPYFYDLLDDIRAVVAHYRKRKRELNSLISTISYWKTLSPGAPEVGPDTGSSSATSWWTSTRTPTGSRRTSSISWRSATGTSWWWGRFPVHLFLPGRQLCQ
jgi:DNA helicase-2/ATP-dependent DNA helicase PcrA